MELLNSDITPSLQTLLLFDNEAKNEIGGLLTENMPLSLKRRLQKIRNDILKHYEQLVKDEKEVREKATPETLEEELKKLFAEKITIDQEYASLAMIEEIKTSANYNFDVIEKFSR